MSAPGKRPRTIEEAIDFLKDEARRIRRKNPAAMGVEDIPPATLVWAAVEVLYDDHDASIRKN